MLIKMHQFIILHVSLESAVVQLFYIEMNLLHMKFFIQ